MIEFIELVVIFVILIAFVLYVFSLNPGMTTLEALEEIKKMYEKEKRHAEMRKALGIDEDGDKQ